MFVWEDLKYEYRKFGKEYRVSIYIDMDNRFTWMPYYPSDFKVKNWVWVDGIDKR